MSKWKTLRSDTLDSYARARANVKAKDNFQNTLRNMRILSEIDLKKEGLNTFNEKVAVEDNLLNAANDKKLKSQRLIKEASSIKAARNKHKKKEIKENGDNV